MTGPLCLISNHGSPVTLLKFQITPKPELLISSGSKIKEPRYACLSEAKASHSQRMWTEVSSLTPRLLNNGMSSSPSRWKCLLRVLCPVRRPVTTLDWVLLKVRNLTLVPRVGGNRGGTVVKVLCYKSEGGWFNPRWCHWNFSLT